MGRRGGVGGGGGEGMKRIVSEECVIPFKLRKNSVADLE